MASPIDVNKTYRLVRRSLLALGSAALLAACGGGGVGSSAAVPSAGHEPSGVVIGSYFRNARVCVDANENAVCDTGESVVVTDANGKFALPAGGGAVVAEIGTDASRYDPDTGALAPVTSRIVLRAPKESPLVISVHSTSVVAEMDRTALSYASAVEKVAAIAGREHEPADGRLQSRGQRHRQDAP